MLAGYTLGSAAQFYSTIFNNLHRPARSSQPPGQVTGGEIVERQVRADTGRPGRGGGVGRWPEVDRRRGPRRQVPRAAGPLLGDMGVEQFGQPALLVRQLTDLSPQLRVTAVERLTFLHR